MARRLGSTPFRELLPDSLSGDASIRAAAAALDTVLDATTRAITGVLLYARLAYDTGFAEPVAMLPPLARLSELSGGLASLPEPVLDLLAWQLHVEGYETAVDVAAKRQLIAGSLLLHRRRGTPWAVRTALEAALHVPATVQQWFEYGGEPYFFRVRLDVSDAGLDETGVTDAMRIIYDYKNVRSWLDCLETVTTRPLPVSVAVGGIMRSVHRVASGSRPGPCPPYVGTSLLPLSLKAGVSYVPSLRESSVRPRCRYRRPRVLLPAHPSRGRAGGRGPCRRQACPPQRHRRG